MKRIIVATIATIIIILGGIQFLWSVGIRITYNPNIITDWEAVGATAGWVSAIATILIPIAVVYIQHKLDKNKYEIGEANKATLAELKKFKDEYSEFMNSINSGELIFDCGNSFPTFTEERVINYITASINVTKKDIATYFGVTDAQASSMLKKLVEKGMLVLKRTKDNSTYSIIG